MGEGHSHKRDRQKTRHGSKRDTADPRSLENQDSVPACSGDCLCSGTGSGLCPVCTRSLNPLRVRCLRCGGERAGEPCTECTRHPGEFVARSLLRFDAASRRLVVAMKRRGPPSARWFGVLMASIAPDNFEVVCWVPGGGDSRRRGFDHAKRLAAGVAYAMDADLKPLLERTGEGDRQADLPAHERKRNARSRFTCSRRLRGAVLLVDDVWTTGATATVCAGLLRDAGAERVGILTLARTPRLASSV